MSGSQSPDELVVQSSDWWFKVIEMLQQNWAIIEPGDDDVTVYFVTDTGAVLDQLEFPNARDAAEALAFNGFRRYAEDEESQRFIAPPKCPLCRREHPNGRIYSSGRFWRPHQGERRA